MYLVIGKDWMIVVNSRQTDSVTGLVPGHTSRWLYAYG